LSEDTRGHRRRREARGEYLYFAFAHRVERGAEGQARPGFESSRKRDCHHADATGPGRKMMRKQNRLLAISAVFILAFANVVSMAQQTLDRTKVPPPGATPVLHVPAWTKTQLANGATLIVSERHNLPLVSFSITFVGGSNQFEPAA